MTATGARRGNLVYHWKHGWIPLDHFAALSKAKGSHKGAAKIMDKHSIEAPKDYKAEPAGLARLRESSNSAAEKHGLPFRHGDRVRVTTLSGGTHGHGTVAGISPDGHNVHVRTDAGSLEVIHRSAVHPAGSSDVHTSRAIELRTAAAKKRAEADRIANGVGASDRAGAMLRAKDSNRMNARMDSGLRRFTEKQREAKALESKARLAEGRARTAAEKQAASDLGVTASKLSRGDLIQHKGQAHMVTKVNKTTVSVPSIVGGPWEDKLPIGGISQHVKLADMKENTLRTLMSRAKGNAALQSIYVAELKRRGLVP